LATTRTGLEGLNYVFCMLEHSTNKYYKHPFGITPIAKKQQQLQQQQKQTYPICSFLLLALFKVPTRA